jgi:hypothetical protein
MIVLSVAVAALMIAGVLFWRTFGCKDEGERFMDRTRDHERARLSLAAEIVDRNRAAHIEAFEAEHGPVDSELVARFEKALDR